MGGNTSSEPYKGPVFNNQKMTDITVYYGANWDGGQQERDVVSRFIAEVVPDAKITAKQVSRGKCLCFYFT